MSDNPRPPRRPLGDREDKDKNKPFGTGSGGSEPRAPKRVTSPTDPYPWAKEEDEKPAQPNPEATPPTAPYPWANDEAPKKPAPPPDPNRVPPTAPYPWADDEAPKKPSPPPDPNRVPPTAPYPWADDEAPKKPTPPPTANKVAPTTPYPWAKDEAEKKPAPPDANKVAPTEPYPWAKDGEETRQAPPRPSTVSPTAPYPWADEPAPPEPHQRAGSEAPEEDRLPAHARPSSISPTAPYPWSDEADAPAPAEPDGAAEVDPRSLSWADLLAGVEQTDAAPPEADLIDEAPLEPLLPSEAAPAERPRLSDAKRFLPTEEVAPPERVTDRFLKRGTFLRRSSAAIPATSYLAEDAVPAPAPIAIQVVPLLRTLGFILGSALLVATLFTWWTPNNFLPPASAGQLAIAMATQGGLQAGNTAPPPTLATMNTIGVVSGHRGINPSSGLPDPGAVCADGLTEESLNATIATKVAQLLQSDGYEVDVFDEFDKQLEGYRALAMVSIHADSCQYVNDEATGFKVASFQASTQPERDQRLVNCIIQHYAQRTGLPLHPGVTLDMTDYHNFREIDPQTPGVVVETGFMYLDRNYLTSHPDDIAHGIVDGLLCYLHGDAGTPAPAITPLEGTGTATPTPTVTLTPTDFGALFNTVTPGDTPLPPDQITPAP